MKRFLFGIALLIFVNGIANATPTNDQIYQMLLEVKAEQEKLKKEATEAKKRESDLRNELNQTKAKLLTAKKQLDESFVEKQDKLNITEGFFASASGIYVRPLIDTGRASNVIEPDYEPGFQVAIGYQAADNWDYTLRFRHFSAKESFSNKDVFNGFVEMTSEKYKMNYDVLDFEIGKQLSLSDNVTLRMSGGLRYAALDEGCD